MIRYFSIFVCLLFVCACGSKTTVILLPQEDGKTGSIIVKTKSASTVLDKPYTYTTLHNDQLDLSAKSIDKGQVADQYRILLAAEPAKPVSFILYFNGGTASLTNESLKLIPQILKSAKEREPSEVSIIGHTDTKGSAEYNNKLSLERANEVAKIIKGFDTDLKNIYISSHGESDLLIITDDNISEERNRRVEIMIR